MSSVWDDGVLCNRNIVPENQDKQIKQATYKVIVRYQISYL